MREIICGIYKITNPSGKIYIGQSIDIIKRMRAYNNYECYKSDTSKIFNSIKKHGWDKHKVEIIHRCNINELDKLEIYYIEVYQSLNPEIGLNLKMGGANGVHSDETIRKMKLSHSKRKPITNETKLKMGIAHKGKVTTFGLKHSIEAINKISISSNKRWEEYHKNKSKQINVIYKLTSNFNGVHLKKHKLKYGEVFNWTSTISINNKSTHLGMFPNTPCGELLAALKYDEMAIKYHGDEYSKLNFKLSPCPNTVNGKYNEK